MHSGSSDATSRPSELLPRLSSIAAGARVHVGAPATAASDAASACASATAASAGSGALLSGLGALQRAYHSSSDRPAAAGASVPLERACLRSQLACLRTPPLDVDHGGAMRVPICAPPWYASCRVCGARGHFYTQCHKLKK